MKIKYIIMEAMIIRLDFVGKRQLMLYCYSGYHIDECHFFSEMILSLCAQTQYCAYKVEKMPILKKYDNNQT